MLGSSPAEMQAVFSVLHKHVWTYSSSIQNIFPCNYKDLIFFSASVEYSILKGNTVPLKNTTSHCVTVAVGSPLRNDEKSRSTASIDLEGFLYLFLLKTFFH